MGEGCENIKGNSKESVTNIFLRIRAETLSDSGDTYRDTSIIIIIYFIII
jgi:hypothetical protein